MDHLITRITEDLIARVTGPMKFRLVLQPCMATFFAIRDGLKDAREGKPAYFWALFTDKGEREAAMKDGWKGVGKGVYPRGRSRCGLSAHRAPVDGLSRRSNIGRNHSSYHPLPAVPRAY